MTPLEWHTLQFCECVEIACAAFEAGDLLNYLRFARYSCQRRGAIVGLTL